MLDLAFAKNKESIVPPMTLQFFNTPLLLYEEVVIHWLDDSIELELSTLYIHMSVHVH